MLRVVNGEQCWKSDCRGQNLSFQSIGLSSTHARGVLVCKAETYVGWNRYKGLQTD